MVLYINYPDSLHQTPTAHNWQNINSEATEDICTAWRKALWMLWGLHPMIHCDKLAGLSDLKPLDVQLKYRFICFLKKCLNHYNATVKNVALNSFK